MNAIQPLHRPVPLSQVGSQELLRRTKGLVAEERRTTLALIEHLEEIQRRMLYAEMGYSSLWDFATQELGLSEGAAQRRIQAMRLVRDVPEAKQAIEAGKLSLSNAAKVQSFRQAEKKHGRKADAHDLVAKVSQLSQRECEQVLFEISPQSMPQERERIISVQEDRELKLVVSADTYDKLMRLKGLLAHTLQDATLSELLKHMTCETLAREEKKRGLALSNNDATRASTAPAAVPTAGKRVHLPTDIRRTVWAKAQGQCEFTTSNHRRCSSRFRLEIDHQTPLALGGTNELSNLRLLCWHHHRQQTLLQFR